MNFLIALVSFQTKNVLNKSFNLNNHPLNIIDQQVTLITNFTVITLVEKKF